jgi:hypothetical protein
LVKSDSKILLAYISIFLGGTTVYVNLEYSGLNHQEWFDCGVCKEAEEIPGVAQVLVDFFRTVKEGLKEAPGGAPTHECQWVVAGCLEWLKPYIYNICICMYINNGMFTIYQLVITGFRNYPQ